MNYSACSHPLQVLLWGLQQRLPRGDPSASHVHMKAKTLPLQPVTHLILWPACKRSIDVTNKRSKWIGSQNLWHLCIGIQKTSHDSKHTRGTKQANHFVRLNTQTYLFAVLRSRDQPNLGPAVARTPPLLKSPSGRLSSRLNVVDWLLFSLKIGHSIIHVKTFPWSNLSLYHRIVLHIDKTQYYDIQKRFFVCVLLKIKRYNFYVIFYSLPKEFLYSLWFFPALWSRRQRVCTVAVSWPLWQPGQIQMVGALALHFSCKNKYPQNQHHKDPCGRRAAAHGLCRDPESRQTHDVWT